jgi:hypothetical protein
MSYASMKKLEGVQGMGSAVPSFDPGALRIVGLDVPETADNWFAHCARLKDVKDEDITEYAEALASIGHTDHIVKAYRDGNSLVVIDGRTTTRAARMARSLQAKRRVSPDELITVRVAVVSGTPDELYRANLDSHKHLPLTRTQYAKGVLKYHQVTGEKIDQTAKFFRVDPATVRLLLAHFDLSPKVQNAIDERKLPATVTKKLASLPRAEQDAALRDMLATGSTKGAAAHNAADKAAKREKIEKKDVTRMRSRAFLEKWLEELRKAGGFSELQAMVEFILGGDLPREIRRDAKLLAAVEAAGFKVEKD